MATPTTLPSTFTTGQILTAAQMNNLRGAFRILQVVNAQKTDSFATTSTTFVDVTGVSASITPSDTTSKIFVIISGLVSNSQGATQVSRLNLVRGATNIAQSTGGTNNETHVDYTKSDEAGQGFAITTLDSPSTTSATTYKLQAAASGGTLRIGALGFSDTTYRAVTNITLLEVSA
jgi:hypothetical protein